MSVRFGLAVRRREYNRERNLAVQDPLDAATHEARRQIHVTRLLARRDDGPLEQVIHSLCPRALHELPQVVFSEILSYCSGRELKALCKTTRAVAQRVVADAERFFITVKHSAPLYKTAAALGVLKRLSTRITHLTLTCPSVDSVVVLLPRYTSLTRLSFLYDELAQCDLPALPSLVLLHARDASGVVFTDAKFPSLRGLRADVLRADSLAEHHTIEMLDCQSFDKLGSVPQSVIILCFRLGQFLGRTVRVDTHVLPNVRILLGTDNYQNASIHYRWTSFPNVVAACAVDDKLLKSNQDQMRVFFSKRQPQSFNVADATAMVALRAISGYVRATFSENTNIRMIASDSPLGADSVGAHLDVLALYTRLASRDPIGQVPARTKPLHLLLPSPRTKRAESLGVGAVCEVRAAKLSIMRTLHAPHRVSTGYDTLNAAFVFACRRYLSDDLHPVLDLLAAVRI